MSNILEAIYNIANLKQQIVEDITFGSNRATSMGDGLETFIKNAFANSFGEMDKQNRILKYQSVFSYQGSSRTPPDIMLRNGDAIEVKKTESLTTDLQLNSSHPKNILDVNSPLINKHCRDCEDWNVKDFIYIIGHLPKGTKTLSSLWMIDGSVYAADEEVYLSLKNLLNEQLENTPDIDFSPTREIGRVNNVDPLKITNLRIRGMWLLRQPYKVFDYAHNYDSNKKFQCICIIPSQKYVSFPSESIKKVEQNKQISVSEIKVLNPNNPSLMIDCKLINFSQ